MRRIWQQRAAVAIMRSLGKLINRFFRYVNSCNSFIAIYRAALGTHKYLITHNATSCKLASIAAIAYFRIVITYAITGEVQGCLIWEVNF